MSSVPAFWMASASATAAANCDAPWYGTVTSSYRASYALANSSDVIPEKVPRVVDERCHVA